MSELHQDVGDSPLIQQSKAYYEAYIDKNIREAVAIAALLHGSAEDGLSCAREHLNTMEAEYNIERAAIEIQEAADGEEGNSGRTG